MIKEYLETVINDKIRETQKGDQYKFNCPFCGEIRHRAFVSTVTHQFYCHNCGTGLSFPQFIMEIEGISYEKAAERYKETKGSAYIPDDILEELHKNLVLRGIKHTLPLVNVRLPEEYMPLNFDSDNIVMKRAIKHLLSRRISIRQMKQHKFGLCLSGDYTHRIIIPITEMEEVKFFVARSIGVPKNAGKGFLKEKSPSTEDYQYSKSQVLFNIDNAAKIFNSCVLSEGIYDALSFDGIGVSALGKRVSEEQLALMLDYKEYLTNGVYIALDSDAVKDSLKLADNLIQYFPVKLIELPRGHDPNSYLKAYGKKAMYDLVDSAHPYDLTYKLKRKFFV